MADDLAELPRILVFAYACEPGRGSEPGAGWGIVQALARVARCTVLVGPEHERGLKRWASGGGHPNIDYRVVEEPSWGAHAKHHRITWFPLYLHWLRRARSLGLRLHQVRPFDLIYHATYSSFWLPSPVTTFGVPSVWGPVGGAVVTPSTLWGLLGVRGLVGEMLDAVATSVLTRLPATRRTWRRATVRIVQNDATLAALPAALQPTTRVLNHATLIEVPPLARRRPTRRILSIGLLESRKGVALAIHGMTHAAPDVRLVIVGDGPQRKSLESLVRRLGLDQRVEFLGRVARADVFQLLEEAAGVVFTGLREEGGLALAEAMYCGVPIIVLAHGGATTLAAASLDPSRVVLVPPGTIRASAVAIGAAMTRLCDELHTERTAMLDASGSLASLQAAVASALEIGGRTGGVGRLAATAAAKGATR
jgi:glycosyltransferase involved in cell wall biosynthesis